MALPFLDEIPETPKEVEEKKKSLGPFDFVNAIHFSKDPLIVDEDTERQYNPYVVNKALSFGADTIIPANEMNSRPHINKKMAFDFLINIIRPRKRFNKWLKAEKIEHLELVKEYYGFSTQKAQDALRILTPDQIDYIKSTLDKGGT